LNIAFPASHCWMLHGYQKLPISATDADTKAKRRIYLHQHIASGAAHFSSEIRPLNQNSNLYRSLILGLAFPSRQTSSRLPIGSRLRAQVDGRGACWFLSRRRLACGELCFVLAALLPAKYDDLPRRQFSHFAPMT
jgi:hypothetical protein